MENTSSGKSLEDVSELKVTTEIPGGLTTKEANPMGSSSSSTSSGSNPESLSTYAERKLAAIVQRDNTVSSRPPNLIVTRGSGSIGDKPEKESECCPNTNTPAQPLNIENQDKTVEEILDSSGEDDTEQRCTLHPSRPVLQDLYSTDASEVEELLDGSGVSGTVLWGISASHFNVSSSSQEDGDDNDGATDFPTTPVEGTADPNTPTSAPPRQLSVSGRAAIRKCFIETQPIQKLLEQPVVAFCENQVHTILRTISDESLLSSFHLMKSLLRQAADGKIITKERCRHVNWAETPYPDSDSSSSGEYSDAYHSSGGYTSGALNSDEDPGSLNLQIEVDESPRVTKSRAPARPQTRNPSTMIVSPGSCYSVEDYAPLSSLLHNTTSSKRASKPPRKRQRVSVKPGKVMKEAYFKGINWTKKFVTGPLEPAHNQHKFYCQLCKAIVSIFSTGAGEIIRHYLGESHLRKDQRWRFEHLGVTDKITGITQRPRTHSPRVGEREASLHKRTSC